MSRRVERDTFGAYFTCTWCVDSAEGLHDDTVSSGKDDGDGAISLDQEEDLQSSLEAAEAMAAAAEAAAASDAAVPGADWAASPAAALLIAGAAAASSPASAAGTTSQPAAGGAAGSQLPLPAGQPQLVSLAPPSLAGAAAHSVTPAATVAAAAQSLSLGLPSSAGVPARSTAPAAAAGATAVEPLPQALQSTAPYDVPIIFPNGPLATELLSTSALSAAPGLPPLFSGDSVENPLTFSEHTFMRC